jgi:hypothetical protein
MNNRAFDDAAKLEALLFELPDQWQERDGATLASPNAAMRRDLSKMMTMQVRLGKQATICMMQTGVFMPLDPFAMTFENNLILCPVFEFFRFWGADTHSSYVSPRVLAGDLLDLPDVGGEVEADERAALAASHLTEDGGVLLHEYTLRWMTDYFESYIPPSIEGILDLARLAVSDEFQAFLDSGQ